MHSGVAPFSHGCIEAYDFGNTSQSSAKPRSSNFLLESIVSRLFSSVSLSGNLVKDHQEKYEPKHTPLSYSSSCLKPFCQGSIVDHLTLKTHYMCIRITINDLSWLSVMLRDLPHHLLTFSKSLKAR